jgi:hypothetical protein
MPASTQRWNTKILLAKIEATYGTDSVPVAATDAILAREVALTPMEGSDVSRDLETPWMGPDATLPAELHARLSFRVELAGSGTAGTAPRWSALMRACGCAEVISAGISVTYNPVTDAHQSVTFYLWIGGTRYVLRGARGTARIEISAQGIPYIVFEFWGLFSQPTDVARTSPTLTGWPAPQLASDTNTPTFTLGGADHILRSLTFNLGNTVEPRLLINSEEMWITDKAETVEWQMEAVPLATWNPYALAAAQTTVAAIIAHGVGAGRVCTLNLPRLQVQRPQVTGAQNIKEWSLRGIPLPNAGNDQWTLVLT